MCHLLREPHACVQPEAPSAAPRGPLRPRWVAAAGLALAATVAIAALVAAPPAMAPEPVRQATGLVPVASRADMTPVGGGIERTALPADDDAPGGTGTLKARMGHCQEGM